MFFAQRAEKIEFRCAKEDLGVISEPVAAKTVLPNWFVKLPPIDKARLTHNGITIKRCMPFLDAMMTGWIIPLAASVRLDIKDGGKTVTAGWEFDKIMVSNHHAYQAAGNPLEPGHRASSIIIGPFQHPRAGAACLCHPLTALSPCFRFCQVWCISVAYSFSVHTHRSRWSSRNRKRDAVGSGYPVSAWGC